MSKAPAFNPLPPAVLGLAVVIMGVEGMFWLADRGVIGGAGGIGLRTAALENYAFFGQALDWMIANRQAPPDLIGRFVTYPLLHLGAIHAIFVAMFVLVMGKLVGELFGNLAVLAIFFGASAVGALVYGLALDDPYPLVGGYPGVYGLIGGYTFVLWVRAGQMGESQLTAFRLIGLLLAIQLVFGVFFGLANDWIADLAGFATGFAACFLLVPGGWARLRAKMRGR